MTSDDVDALLGLLARGTALQVPMQTTLFPDTEAIRSTLHAEPVHSGRFVLRTTFREFAAGHGWSCEQTEEEVLTDADLRARLVHVERAACRPDP